MNPKVDNLAFFFKQKNSVSRSPPRISKPQHLQVISFPRCGYVLSDGKMHGSYEFEYCFLTNMKVGSFFFSRMGDGGKGCLGLGYIINERSVIVLLMCLTLSS